MYNWLQWPERFLAGTVELPVSEMLVTFRSVTCGVLSVGLSLLFLTSGFVLEWMDYDGVLIVVGGVDLIIKNLGLAYCKGDY